MTIFRQYLALFLKINAIPYSSFCSAKNRGGPAITLHEAVPDLDLQGFNDKTSSVIVHKGTWGACAEKQTTRVSAEFCRKANMSS
ncbi:MAG: beta/gamma crystallin family protein [Pseudomonadota bacterium]|nr:beta/gamma crystallin family protein [Pseudomonadota bacterium]